MKPFLYCVLYFAVLGMISMAGALLPRRWFKAHRFPYRAYRWEKNGDVYRALGITAWKDKVPDMSRILPFLKEKTVSRRPTAADTERLVQETCVAELIHWLLSALGLACLAIWPGAGGWIMAIAYFLLGQLPFILIQRFNRPRLVELMRRLRIREAKNFPQN